MPSTEPYPSAVGTAPPPRRVLWWRKLMWRTEEVPSGFRTTAPVRVRGTRVRSARS